MNIAFEEHRLAFLMMLRRQNISNRRILEIMEKVPRPDFIEGTFKKHAFQDIAIPIECGQTISQPSIVAKMTDALDVQSNHKVLELGTGSGYQSAILSYLAKRVYTVERHSELVRSVIRRFQLLSISNVSVIFGDGSWGLPEHAPFDRIIVTAAAEDIPAVLHEQLMVGGIMVLPVGPLDGEQTLLKVTKYEDGLEYEELGDVQFVPLLEGHS